MTKLRNSDNAATEPETTQAMILLRLHPMKTLPTYIVQILNGVQNFISRYPVNFPNANIISYTRSLQIFTNCTKLGLLPCRKIFKVTAGNSHFSFLSYNGCTGIKISRCSLSIPSFQVLADTTTDPRTSRFRCSSTRIAKP
ncbi:hypothetical protein V8G54_014849 [Vigna mungo]|uniref:Uncharacterized protein n=1 Tax=Vigna mungo TaxID=3915 RepID=A0AAQ3NHF1_VIGMU